MPGPPPKDPSERRRRNLAKPQRGEWVHAPGSGWRHGRKPRRPDGLTEASVKAWSVWLSSWPASFWEPHQVPLLRRLVRLHDQIERLEDWDGDGKCPPIPYAEFRQLADQFGVSPKGVQDRRWMPPKVDGDEAKPAAKPAAYGHLKAVN